MLCAACNDVSEHACIVYSSVSVDVKNKKIIQIKINPTDRVKFWGASRRQRKTFCIGLMVEHVDAEILRSNSDCVNFTGDA